MEDLTKPTKEVAMSERVLWMQDCSNLVYNPTIIQKFKDEKYDLAIVDGFILCYYVLPYNLGIPYVTTTSLLYTKNFKLNPLIYALPCDIQAKENTLWNRYQHMLAVKEFEMMADWILDETEFLKGNKGKAITSLGELQGKSALILFNQNAILDCPIPVLPNMILMGGVGTKPAQPLKDTFLDIYNKANHGVIVMSFGSFVEDISDHILRRFLNVFKKLDQKIVMRHKVKEESIIKTFPDNVYIVDWLPQNDLLGNEKTKLFITHGGNNGQTEGLYNAVPMLTMPIYGDQPYNARRAEYKQWALTLNIMEFTETELENTIKELISNPKYKSSISKASKLFKYYLKKENIHQKMVTAIDELLKFGSSHIETNIPKLGYYEALMWDFLLLIFVLLTLILFSFLYVISSFLGMGKGKKVIKSD